MSFTDYINPALLMLIPVMWIVGKFIKDGSKISNRFIPLILGAMSVVLAAVWVLATSDITGWQNVMMAVFTAFVQGVLCAGTAVYGNQIIKQMGAKK